MAKAVAFDEIDKAPEEKARGITIATAHGEPSGQGSALPLLPLAATGRLLHARIGRAAHPAHSTLAESSLQGPVAPWAHAHGWRPATALALSLCGSELA